MPFSINTHFFLCGRKNKFLFLFAFFVFSLLPRVFGMVVSRVDSHAGTCTLLIFFEYWSVNILLPHNHCTGVWTFMRMIWDTTLEARDRALETQVSIYCHWTVHAWLKIYIPMHLSPCKCPSYFPLCSDSPLWKVLYTVIKQVSKVSHFRNQSSSPLFIASKAEQLLV